MGGTLLIAILRELGHLGGATFCDLVLWLWTSFGDLLAHCLGKALSPTGIGQEFVRLPIATHSRHIYIYIHIYIYLFVYLFIYLLIFTHTYICIYICIYM